MDRINQAGNKRLRGEIIHMLHLAYPNPMETRTLNDVLRDAGYPVIGDISPHLDYLEDKGYIRIDHNEDAKLVSAPVTLCKLSAKGVDLAEYTIEDPGVDV